MDLKAPPYLKLLSPWFFRVFVLIALLNISKLFTVSFSTDSPSDFRTLYVGQQLLVQGINPYQDEALKSGWRKIIEDEQLDSRNLPGFPETPLLYPPWALALFAPFSLLPYRVAYLLWYALLPVFFLLILYQIKKISFREYQLPISLVDLAIVALAFKNTVPAFLVGQPMFLCLLLGFTALRFYKTRKIMSGILLAFAAFKITLALPFLIYLLLKKAWKVLAVSLFSGFILSCLALFLTPDIPDLVRSYFAMVQLSQQAIFQSSASEKLPYFMPLLTEIGVLISYCSPGWAKWNSLFSLILIFLALLFFHKKLSVNQSIPLFTFSLVSLLVLLTTYHLLYDCLILLPLFIFFQRQPSGKRKIWAAFAGSILFLPVNRFLNEVNIPEGLNFLFLSTPVTLLVLLIVFLMPAEQNQKLTES